MQEKSVKICFDSAGKSLKPVVFISTSAVPAQYDNLSENMQ